MPSIDGPVVAALDVGTSSVRALAFDRRGRQVEGLGVSLPHKPETGPDGACELDGDFLVARCIEAVGGLADQATRAGIGLAAVGTCTFWHSVIGVGRDGRAVTPIYMWADTRSGAQAEALRRNMDERRMHARTGCRLHPSYPPARLSWVREHQSDRFAAAHQWLSPGEYLYLRLFGRPQCSFSMASGSGFLDQHRLEWDETVLQAVGLQAEQLGELVDIDEPAQGVLDRELRAALRQAADIPWFPAAGDGACSNLGAGCIDEGRLAVMIGTSGAMRVCLRRERLTWPWGVWAYRVDRRHFLLGGALSNGGNLVAWLREHLGALAGNDVDALLEGREPDAHGLTFLPFLSGERSPGWAADATGVIAGLRQHTQPVDLLQAGMEAVTHRFVMVYECLGPAVEQVQEVVATGGALLRSRAWRRMIADALGRPVRPSLEPEGSARGAALLALRSLGAASGLHAFDALLDPPEEPDPGAFDRYRKARDRQYRLYQQVIGRP